jgi:uncharacterized membrane protein
VSRKENTPPSSNEIATSGGGAPAELIQDGELLPPYRDQNRNIVFASFSGPMPAPQVLRGYNDIVPGAAERIMLQYEADAKHHREMSKLALTAEVADSRRAHYIAAFIVLVGIGVAAWLALAGLASVAIALVSVLLISVLANYLNNKRTEPEPAPPPQKQKRKPRK